MNPRHQAALETCQNFLSPGKKWRLSPYLLDLPFEQARFIPIYQAAILDLLRLGQLPASLLIGEIGSRPGLAVSAALDALLAWETACALYDIPSGLEQVQVALPAEAADRRILTQYRQALTDRAQTLPHLYALSRAAQWAEPVSPANSNPPHLLFAPFPWEQPRLEQWLDGARPGALVVAMEWPRPTASAPRLFQWRYELLRQRTDFVTLGPCGAEYGRHLPDSCRTCHHARQESWHQPGGDGSEQVSIWSYVILGKQSGPAAAPPGPLVTADTLGQAETERLYGRYVGTFRQKEVQAGHPDTANDDPNDETWREYLKFCSGHSPASRLALERRAGMQIPRLHYGQWLPLRQARPAQPYPARPDVYTLKVQDETAFQPDEALPVGETFVKVYTPAVRAAVDEAGYRLFGFPAMREFQHTILARVLTGGDMLAIAATGGGKSECYILPAMLLPGVTVVVSPLKSLILDQYEQRMRDRYGLDHLTTFINGDVPFYERQGRLRRLELGYYKLIYTTPEQLERSYVLDALRQADRRVGVRYLAMDEAHCISQWGHDFRPSYLNIVQRLQGYELSPRRIALTATASPLVRDDVCDELRLQKAGLAQGGDVFIDSSNRPELNLVVRRVKRTTDKARLIVEALRQLNGRGSAIVFMPHTGGPPGQPYDFGVPPAAPDTRNAGMVSTGVSPFARYLEGQLNQPVAIYHGAMEDEAAAPNDETDNGGAVDSRTRQAEQRQFITGQKRIMVATKGFGMGIDKPDIRLVIHRTPPANLEAYAQEAGRAGRDQQLATVMLLFSEDAPRLTAVPGGAYLRRDHLPADRDIQQYFIEQKYVRRQDVQAMLAFLRGDQPRRINGHLYFTNDQVMAAFEQYAHRPRLAGLDEPYQWPAFSPRRKTGVYESEDHQRILDTGHAYYQKQVHLGRILAALFNNRPTLAGQITPALHTVHEIGIVLTKFRLYRPEDIVTSPVYFGDYLRQAGISAADLRRLLPNGDQVDLMPLARRLGRSLRETVSMLQDIRHARGRTNQYGHWQGFLLDFWWAEAPRWAGLADTAHNLSAWRDYAGARRRVRPPAGRQQLDDFFPRKTVNSPRGWEVQPGAGLDFPEAAYLDAFMTLHDERQRNDQDNFAYLLDRYVGRDDDNDQRGECLRSLLLGYLKTNEVVLGGNCFGCSVCVPDLDFERYPVEKRQAVVVRLLPETITLIDRLETHSRQAPSSALLTEVLGAISREDEAGRSGTAYLDSWLARLIQDDPDHQGALWLRLEAFESGQLRLSLAEAVVALERLGRVTQAVPDLGRLQQIVGHCRQQAEGENEHLSLTRQAAELAHRLKQWSVEAGHWQSILVVTEEVRSNTTGFTTRQQALSRLLDLYQPEGGLPNRQLAAQTGLTLAQLPGLAFGKAVAAYAVVARDWDWPQVEMELSSGPPQPAAALVGWLEHKSRPGEEQGLLTWLENNSDQWQTWPSDVIQMMGEKLDLVLDRQPMILAAIADSLFQNLSEPEMAARYLLRAWFAGVELSQGRLKGIAEYFTRLPPAWSRNLLAQNPEAAGALLEKLQSVRAEAWLPPAWLPHLPTVVVSQLPDRQVLHWLEATDLTRPPLDPTLLNQIVNRLGRSDQEGWVDRVVELAHQYPWVGITLLQTGLELGDWPRSAIQTLFPAVLSGKEYADGIKRILNKLTFQFEAGQGQSLFDVCVDNWRTLLIHQKEISFLNGYRIEGAALVNFVDKWLSYQDKPHRLDMIVIILRAVRRQSTATWLTPVSLEFQALCAGGRFAEAERLAADYDGLRVRGQPAGSYLSANRAKIPEREAIFEAEFQFLWDLMNQR